LEIRKAKSEEYDQIYLLGYDVWGEGNPVQKYLDDCRSSKKYDSGEWFVLVSDSKIISALIVYDGYFGLDNKYYGFGSIATDLKSRKKGYAKKLIHTLCDRFKNEGVNGIYLYSDIDDEFYKKIGFSVVLSDGKSSCMLNSFNKANLVPMAIPTYF
jgi:predicted acetyltransferase